MVNIDDISMKELKEKAKIIAEGTGRSYESVLEDLLDDGVVNLSNEQRKDGSLVDQLKEAAELIATVQSISNQVSENTVLNGADNKTEVVVESTLEGDLIDRAIDSVQRKADNIKKILLTLAPVFLLLTGGSLEAIGITDFVGSDDDYENDETYIEYGGCLAADAANYDPMASWDDGSCFWDDNNGGGGGPPDCSENWRWENVVIRDFDANGEGYNNDIEMRTVFEDVGQCNRYMEGYFEITIWDEDRGDTWGEHIIYDKFRDRFFIDHHEYDLPEGDYVISINYEFADSFWEGPSALVTMEAPDPVEEIGCDAYLINSQAYLEESDSEGDAVTMSADIAIVPEEDNCKDQNFEILWQLYEYKGASIVKYEHTTWESGESSDPDGADYVSHTWDNVDEGTYDPKVSLFLDGDKLDEKWIAHTISIEAETSEPETCEINIFQMDLFTNTTHATVNFDLDCGYEPNELEGYNVSVQFLIYEVNATANDNSLQYVTCIHYIQGFVGDIQVIVLDNFSQNNTTHYDIYWYAVWIDGDNQQQFLEQKWLNREMNPEA